MALRDVKPISIPLELDKPRTLMFDLNAFAELEEVYGSVEKAFSALEAKSIKAVRTLLWAGLLHEDESLTQRKVGAMITLSNVDTVLEIVTNALLDAMPSSEDIVKTEEVAPADPP